MVLILILVLENLALIVLRHRPHGMLHIDEYQDKDVYRMLYFVPVEDLKKYKHLRLNVETQKWNSLNDYEFDADFEGSK